jgi:hypothetical protein
MMFTINLYFSTTTLDSYIILLKFVRGLITGKILISNVATFFKNIIIYDFVGEMFENMPAAAAAAAAAAAMDGVGDVEAAILGLR